MALNDREDEWDKKSENSLRYSIWLMIQHPNIDPAKITETLGLRPNVSGIAGSRRMTPAGKTLPSTHKLSEWSHWFRVERSRRFFIDVVRVIDRLEPHRDFLLKIVGDGGTIDLTVHLPGDVNIGSDFPWQEMSRLCGLRIDLGVEIFPDFN
jgi:hypothetical protein